MIRKVGRRLSYMKFNLKKREKIYMVLELWRRKRTEREFGELIYSNNFIDMATSRRGLCFMISFDGQNKNTVQCSVAFCRSTFYLKGGTQMTVNAMENETERWNGSRSGYITFLGKYTILSRDHACRCCILCKVTLDIGLSCLVCIVSRSHVFDRSMVCK